MRINQGSFLLFLAFVFTIASVSASEPGADTQSFTQYLSGLSRDPTLQILAESQRLAENSIIIERNQRDMPAYNTYLNNVPISSTVQSHNMYFLAVAGILLLAFYHQEVFDFFSFFVPPTTNNIFLTGMRR